MAKFTLEVEIKEGYTNCENCPFSDSSPCAGEHINCGIYNLNKMILLSLNEEDSDE